MAADTKTLNGSHGAQPPYAQYGSPLPSQSSTTSTGPVTAGAFADDGAVVSTTNSVEPAASAEAGKTPSKDEVGWYFVESYYTTLSKNPETLYLYYNKRSQFVCGLEAEKADVSVGQRAIGDRIKKLGFQDCKVRVSNVDSQESNKSIVVSVIGEISNKAAPHRRFTQTFVLAEQPNGYFVLNDMFRYLLEEEEEPIENGGNEEPAPGTTAAAEPETLTGSDDPGKQQRELEEADKKLEQGLEDHAVPDEIPTKATANGYAAPEEDESHPVEVAPPAATEETVAEEVEDPTEPTAVKQEAESEQPHDPDPTPIASPPKPAKAASVEPAPAAAPKAAAPKTWANLVAANRTAAAVPPISNNASAATPTPPSQPKAAPPAVAQTVTPPTSTGEESPVKAQQNGNSGWQMAGSDTNKKQGRQHAQSISSQGNIMAYVKNVTEKVDASLLKQTLLQYGKLPYFDVSRQKNCAFVEFEDQVAYNNAVAANPHVIGGEQIYVEERRPRSNAYGGNFANRGSMRGGRGGNEGRPGSQGRGGFPKEGGRGGFVSRGRGGNITTRGRGQPQAA